MVCISVSNEVVECMALYIVNASSLNIGLLEAKVSRSTEITGINFSDSNKFLC